MAAASLLGAVGMAAALSAIVIATRDSPGFSMRTSAFLRGIEHIGTSEVIRQVGEYDCGPAALAMVLRDHGQLVEPAAMAAAWGFSDREISFADMIRVADSFGLHATPWILSWSDFLNAPKPVIARIDSKHFVVVDDVSDAGVVVRDPAIGVLRYSKSAFLRAWKGESLIFASTVRAGFAPGGAR